MQNQDKILIYIDILGFESRANEIGKALGLPATKIRKDFLTTINEKILALKENKIIDTFSYGERDDWILVSSSINQAFQAINNVLDHNVFYPKFEKIPLEIAIGTGEYDQWTKFDDNNLIIENGTIRFLKTKIISDYHKWYKRCNSDKSPHDSFIVLTESFFSLLNYSEKLACSKISIEEKIIYLISIENVIEQARSISFLKEIGFPNHTRYRMIDELFVPPFEYPDMEKTLEKEKILLIIGTQEYGKTFSTVKLLWDYYKKGYTPKWIRGGEDLERNTCRSKLENISTILTPKTIVYFEDPFGKITYERRESLERELGTIVQEIQRMNDVYVIITSREEVFKQFESEFVQFSSINQLKIIFSIKNDSYDYQKRKKILLNWANFLSCKWINEDDIQKQITHAIIDKSKLPTPLAIWNFAIATINLNQKDEVFAVLEEKSQETSIAFAKEIEKMSQDKIIFLTFPVVARYNQQFVSKNYAEIIEKLSIPNAWKFNSLLKWFTNDKIDLVSGAILFSHPSYFESFITIMENEKNIKNNYVISSINAVFDHLIESKGAPAGGVAKFISEHYDLIENERKIPWITKLAENGHAKKWVAKIIIGNYSNLPHILKNKIFQLVSAKDAKSARIISEALSENFEKLPPDVRQNLLLILISHSNSAPAIAEILKKYFNEIPIDLRNQLIFTIAESPMSINFIPEIIAQNYSKSPPEVRSLFFRIAEYENSSGYVAEAIVNNYHCLPQTVRQLLFHLSRNPNAIQKIADSIFFNYENLDPNVKNLLTIYIIDKRAAGIVAVAIINNYDRLPDYIKNLFFAIAREDALIDDLIEPLGKNYDRLPEDIRRLIFDFIKRPEFVGRIAKTVGENFEKIPSDDRNRILFELARSSSSANRVAKILERYFDKIKFEIVLQLMMILAQDDYSSAYVAKILNEKFKMFPLNFSIELLNILSARKNPSKDVAEIIFTNYHYSPEEFQKIIIRLAENEETAQNAALALSTAYSKIPESVSLEIFMKLGNQMKAAQGVAKILELNFNKIPELNRNQILIKMSENYSTAIFLPEIISRKYSTLPEKIRSYLFSLAKCDATASFVVLGISQNFCSAPKNVKDLLLSIADRKCVGSAILTVLNLNINNFPPDYCYQLLIAAKTNEEISPKIAQILLKNYLSLDSNAKAILFELVNDKKIAIDIASLIMKNYDAMPKDIKNLCLQIMNNLREDNLRGQIHPYFC